LGTLASKDLRHFDVSPFFVRGCSGTRDPPGGSVRQRVPATGRGLVPLEQQNLADATFEDLGAGRGDVPDSLPVSAAPADRAFRLCPRRIAAHGPRTLEDPGNRR